MNKKTFLQQTGTLLNFVPPGGLGAFDIEFDPGAKKMHINVDYCLKKSDPSAQLHLKRFSRAFKKNISKHWNGKAVLTCAKTGWEDIELAPTFSVREVNESHAHYVIEIQPETDADHLQGPVAAVTHTPVNKKKGFQPRKAKFGAAANLDKEVSSYHRDITWQLHDGFHIALKMGALGWKAGADPMGVQRLQRFARNVVRFKVPKAFQSSARPTILVKGIGLGSQWALAEAARDYLKSIGLKNKFIVSDGGNKDKAAGVIVSIDHKEMVRLFPKNPAGNNSFFKEITVVHEFGHMLGLPDEYVCLSKNSQDAMTEVYSIDQNQAASFKGLMGDLVKPQGAVKSHQEEYVRMCSRANLAPPSFGVRSSSLMACGTVLHPTHFVTIREALAKYSGVDDWKIKIL